MSLKRYIRNHAIAVLAMAVFAVYGFITTRLLPFNTLHCFMHDILHLYCPFCGGTRAFLALLQLDLLAMLTYNPAVVLATLLFLVLDLRALVLLLRHRDDALFPRFLLPLAVVWFLLYTVLRNALALFGIDPVGDIAPYWQGRITPPLAVLATCLLLLVAFSLLGALYLPQRRLRRPFIYLAALWAILLVSVLFRNAWLLLLLLLPAGVYMIPMLIRRKKSPSGH